MLAPMMRHQRKRSGAEIVMKTVPIEYCFSLAVELL
jgi:hypothetical protein